MTLSTRRFGRTGRTPTAIGFGAWAIGGSWGDVSEADAKATLHAALLPVRESAPGLDSCTARAKEFELRLQRWRALPSDVEEEADPFAADFSDLDAERGAGAGSGSSGSERVASPAVNYADAASPACAVAAPADSAGARGQRRSDFHNALRRAPRLRPSRHPGRDGSTRRDVQRCWPTVTAPGFGPADADRRASGGGTIHAQAK